VNINGYAAPELLASPRMVSLEGCWRKHRIESPRFTRVELLLPNHYLYQFRIRSEKDLDAEVLSWLREAYKTAMQEG